MIYEIKEKIKEKIRTTILVLKGGEASERTAILTTILAVVLLLMVFFLIIRVVLPRTQLDINVSGPETAIAGEEITYNVTVKNTGNVVLQKPELVFHFPSLSLPEKSLIETIIIEENLYPNQEKHFEFKTQLFGKEEERREAKTWLNYSTEKNPTLKMSKIVNLATHISEVPIDLVLDLPKKIAIFPGIESEFILRARYLSLIDHPIPDLKLSISFPGDFNFKESMPSKEDKTYWEIPKLESLSRGEVEIMGFFPIGQELGKEMDFTAELSINLHGTDVLLKEFKDRATTFEPNFLFTKLINNRQEYFPYPGENLHYEIYFKNIRNEPLSNLVLTTILEGNLYDLATIESPSGTFHQGGRSITWSGEAIPQLRYITPGEEGKVEFWVQLKEDYKPKDIFETSAAIRNRVVLGDFEKEFRNRVSSRIKITQEAYHKDAYQFFDNVGPHPPEVLETTNYTIVWKLENYYNWIENVQIKATLPSRIHFRSVKSTQGEIKVVTDPFEVKSPYYPVIPTGFKFENPLYQNLRNEEVRYLQTILKKEVPHSYPEYVPATGYFGSITLIAAKAFQKKYERDILIPQGISQPTGYVDRQTQLKLNELLLAGMPLGYSEVIWEIEKVRPGVGIFEDSWITGFQIAFTPEIAQRDKITNLINEITISAKDQWTGMVLFSADQAIDTTLPDDPSVRGKGTIR